MFYINPSHIRFNSIDQKFPIYLFLKLNIDCIDTQKSAVFNGFVSVENVKYWKKIYFSGLLKTTVFLSFLSLPFVNISIIAHFLFLKKHRHWNRNVLHIDRSIYRSLFIYVYLFYTNYQFDILNFIYSANVWLFKEGKNDR